MKGKTPLCASAATACFMGLTSPASSFACRAAFLAAVIEFLAGFRGFVILLDGLDLGSAFALVPGGTTVFLSVCIVRAIVIICSIVILDNEQCASS